MDIKQIKTFLDSQSGVSMKAYLKAKCDQLKDIENIQEFATPSTQALEIKAQMRAYKKLREILGDIMTFEQEERKKDPRDSFSV